MNILFQTSKEFPGITGVNHGFARRVHAPGTSGFAGRFARLSRWRRAGFTLVEIVLSLGVFTFAIVPIVGIMGVSLNVSNESIQSSVSSLMFRQGEAYLVSGSNRYIPNLPPIYFSNTGDQQAASPGSIYQLNFTNIAPSDDAKGLLARKLVQMTVVRTVTPTISLSQQVFQYSKDPVDLIQLNN